MPDSGFQTSETRRLDQVLAHIGDVEELKSEYLAGLRQISAAWREKIAEIMEKQGYTPQALADLCGVSRSAVVRWQEGSVPSKRDTFIRIGFAAGYSLPEMNKFLQRYGKYNQLYAKSLEDSVYIFILNSETLPHTYAASQALLERIRGRLRQPEDAPASTQETGVLNMALLALETPDELERFIQENLAQYRQAFSKLYERVLDCIASNNWDYLSQGSGDRRESFSVNRLADAQGWSASLRRCVSEIRQRKWLPLRTKIISLGLHLNLNRRRLDELLELAHMEPLCARNPLEGAIIFAIEDADVSELIPDPEFPDASMDLCGHVRDILEQLELPDAQDLIRDILVEW